LSLSLKKEAVCCYNIWQVYRSEDGETNTPYLEHLKLKKIVIITYEYYWHHLVSFVVKRLLAVKLRILNDGGWAPYLAQR